MGAIIAKPTKSRSEDGDSGRDSARSDASGVAHYNIDLLGGSISSRTVGRQADNNNNSIISSTISSSSNNGDVEKHFYYVQRPVAGTDEDKPRIILKRPRSTSIGEGEGNNNNNNDRNRHPSGMLGGIGSIDENATTDDAEQNNSAMLDPAETDFLRAMFKNYDANNNKILEDSELMELLNGVQEFWGLTANEQDVAFLKKELASSRGRNLAWEEFRDIFALWKRSKYELSQFSTAQRKMFRQIFDQYDTNGDGVMQISELEVMMKEMGPNIVRGSTPWHPTQKDLQLMMNILDKNHDGVLSWQEFLAGLSMYLLSGCPPSLLDQEDDGIDIDFATAEDFEDLEDAVDALYKEFYNEDTTSSITYHDNGVHNNNDSNNNNNNNNNNRSFLGTNDNSRHNDDNNNNNNHHHHNRTNSNVSITNRSSVSFNRSSYYTLTSTDNNQHSNNSSIFWTRASSNTNLSNRRLSSRATSMSYSRAASIYGSGVVSRISTGTGRDSRISIRILPPVRGGGVSTTAIPQKLPKPITTASALTTPASSSSSESIIRH